jgi:hypothetical protein
MDAPGRTAPLESFTVPRSDVVADCPNARAGMKSRLQKNVTSNDFTE